MIRVTVYDSSPIFARGLVDVVDDCAEFEIVETFLSVQSKPSWLTDLFVLDAEIDEGTVPRELVSRLVPLAPVLLLARPGMAGAPLEVLMRAGASGFLDKCATPTTLLRAMRSVAVGKPIEKCAAGQPAEMPTSQAPNLSEREEQVLDLIARGMTHHQIASAIKISQHTVDTYVKRIRSKLNLGNKAELTRAAVLRSIR